MCCADRDDKGMGCAGRVRLDSLLVLKESSVNSDVITIDIDVAELHILRVDVIAG
jgi:nitrogenase subunit NifH